MAEGIAFDLVTGVLGKLGSALWDEIGLLRSFKGDAKDLQRQFKKIKAVLLDAEERSSVEIEGANALRIWLSELKGAAYDIDDLLDEIQTQALLRKQLQEVQNQNQLAKNVCAQFLSCANPIHLKFKFKMAHRMKELRENIDKITTEMLKFGLGEAGPRRQAEFKRSVTTISVVDEKKIVGRDDDKEKIVKLLLETGDDHDVSVIPIVGLGGLGKTTLAQMAFNDGPVTDKQRFDLWVWVCVSTDFNMKTIAKAVTYVAQKKCVELDNREAVARYLVEIFSQHRFLLVLDDVWNEEQDKWEDLKVLFKDGKKGSKILVTTRSEKVATIMKTVEQPHRMKGLSDDDCWKLFKRRAFEEGEENDYLHLVEIGKQIVNKCGGLPLAANALGSMMRFKSRTEDAWSAIRDSQIWRLEEEKTILPSLKLSYIQMPSALKQCFAYCSIFPKDYEIDKDDLIHQWIALGFISSHETTCSSMEDIGNEYFNDLLWMSFLQEEKTYRGVTWRMHDLVHDLAQSVAREEVAVIVGEESTSIPEGCRYASIHSRSIQQVPTTVKQRLRALRFGKSASLTTFYSEAKCLRLLDLHDSKISMLPSSIGKLKLLRYLNLSESNIQELPESITGLCNLQTLNLLGCHKICTLPKFLGRLANLRILNLSHCLSLLSLPSSLCQLKNLHDLNLSNLDDLQALPESIKNLENLRILNLSKCSRLLPLPSSLCQLKNLHDLNLSNLGDLPALPESIGNLENLRILNLSRCSRLQLLPSSLCQLKNLHDLNLSYLYKLEALPEFIGNLENLRILNLSNCFCLLSLPSSSSNLQHLEKLDITFCSQLCVLPKMIENLTKLRELLNKNCPGLKGMPRGIGQFVNLRILHIFVIGKQDRVKHCASISELEHLKLVGELEIKGLENITDPVDAMAANLIEKKKLRSLKLKWNVSSAAADEMDAVQPPAEKMDAVLENLQPHQNLEKLVIEGYAGRKFPSWMMNSIDSCLPNLVEIELMDVPRCSSLPPLGLLSLLKRISIRRMPRCSSLPPLGLFPVLKDIYIENMPRCSSLPPLGQLPLLERLLIWNMPLLTNLGVEIDGDSHINESANKFPALRRLDLSDMPTKLKYLDIYGCSSLRYFPVHKMTTLTELDIKDCPLLFNAGGDVRVNERPEPCLPSSVQQLDISGISKECLSLILKRPTMDSETPADDGDAVSLQQPNMVVLRRLTIGKCQQLTCLPEGLRSFTSLLFLTIEDCEDLGRIEDWLGELTKLEYLDISLCGNLRYLPAHKMTSLEKLSISGCPRLFNADDGQFVDTNVDHIKDVKVDGSEYKHKKQVSSL